MEIMMKYAKTNKRTTRILTSSPMTRTGQSGDAILLLSLGLKVLLTSTRNKSQRWKKKKIIYQAGLDFAYACLSHAIQTQEGKLLMQVYHPTSDAQAVI
jgi:hypothetical protein